MKGFKAAIKINSCDSKLWSLCHIVNLLIVSSRDPHLAAKGCHRRKEGRDKQAAMEGEEVIDSDFTLT